MSKFILLFLSLFLILSNLETKAGLVLKVSGKKAVIRTGNLNLEMKKRYILLIRGVKAGDTKILKKKAIVKVVKFLNDKALIRVLRGRVFTGAEIVKVKSYKAKRKKRATGIARQKVSRDIEQNIDRKETKVMSILGGLNLISAGPLVENGEDIGYDFSLIKAVDFGFRYKLSPELGLRASFIYGVGDAEFTLLSTAFSSDVAFNLIAGGGTYHFMKVFYAFFEFGLPKLSLKSELVILGTTTSETTILSGKSLKAGLGYIKKIDSDLSFLIEASMSQLSWSSRESDVEDTSANADNSTTVDYSQSLMQIGAYISYSF